jgi:NarL family two-component system response regulator YdfI
MQTTRLTYRERQVLVLVVHMSNPEIARELQVSDRTVDSHLRTIFNKLGCFTRTEAILKALSVGELILLDEGQLAMA